MRYMDGIDLNDKQQFAKVAGGQTFQVNDQYLKPQSLVLPGAAIFHILFEGTKGKAFFG